MQFLENSPCVMKGGIIKIEITEERCSKTLANMKVRTKFCKSHFYFEREFNICVLDEHKARRNESSKKQRIYKTRCFKFGLGMNGHLIFKFTVTDRTTIWKSQEYFEKLLKPNSLCL